MATPLPDLLARVGELNDPASPFVYAVEGDRIVGTWDIAHVQYVALLGAGQIDQEYRIEVQFQPDAATYSFDETHVTSDFGGGLSSGGFHLGGSKTWVRGKQKRFTFGGVAGMIVNTPEGTGHAATWTFSTDRIKEPLVAFLGSHGWTRRKGFLSRLFG
jgi:hypothetical protein